MSLQTTAELIASLLKREGGYTKDPADSGGETKFGISKKQFPTLNIKDLTAQQASAIYEERYFLKPGLHKLPDSVQAFMFDYAVNSGPAIAIRALQRVVGAEVDGVLGPATLAKVATYTGPLVTELVKERVRMIANLVQKRPQDVKFLEGWLMRVLSFL